MVTFPTKMESYVGRALEKELNALIHVDLKDFVFVLGGAKPEDNMKLLRGNKVLACGLFGQLCTIAKGTNLGAQNEYLKDKLSLVSTIKPKLVNVQTPNDFAVKARGKRKELQLSEFPSEYEIFDIGEDTITRYTQEIAKAKAIYMKGPAGFSADKQFSRGTFAILHAIAKSKAFSIIGGGHLSDAIIASKIPLKKFGHVSLSGGALLSYLAGEKLPGLVALGIQ
jgi:phosphoglycerate kinase